MYKTLSKNISPVIKLLGSGFLTTIGFSILSSDYINYIDSDVITKLLLFISYQMLGLTIAKYGIDTLVYSQFIRDSSFIYNPLGYIKKKGWIIILGISVISIFAFDTISGFFLFFIITFDVISVISIVQISSRGYYNRSLVSNLLMYPSFFFFLILFTYLTSITDYYILLIFLLLFSFLRFIYSYTSLIRIHSRKRFSDIVIKKEIVLQQFLNYGLFRIDQIIISLGGLWGVNYFGYSNEILLDYLFLSKFSEIISGVLVSLSFLYSPILIIDSVDKYKELMKKYYKIAVVYISLIILLMLTYLLVFNKINLFFRNETYAYIINAIFIVIVNMIILGYFKNGKVFIIIKNSSISIGVTIILALIIKESYNYSIIVWMPVFQLIIFSILPFILNKRVND